VVIRSRLTGVESLGSGSPGSPPPPRWASRSPTHRRGSDSGDDATSGAFVGRSVSSDDVFLAQDAGALGAVAKKGYGCWPPPAQTRRCGCGTLPAPWTDTTISV